MIYKKIINIKLLNFSSLLKRFLIVSLSIILCLNTICKPREVKAAAIVPVVTTIVKVCGVIAAVTGAAIGVHEVASWFFDNKNMNEDEVVDYFNKNVSVDGDGNYTFTDDAQLTINQMLTDYNDSVTMEYRYPIKMECVSGENFPDKRRYDIFLKILNNYSDCYAFFLAGDGNSLNISLRGKPVTYLDGTEANFAYDTSADGAMRINIIPLASAGVANNLGLASLSTTLYNDDWEMSFDPRSFYIMPDGRIYVFSSKSLLGYATSFQEVSIDNLPAYEDMDTNLHWSWYGTAWTTFSDAKHSSSLAVKCLYSASPNPLSVYKSEADMKKDIGSQVVGTYTPDYTGQPNYNITTSEVNNIVNNYYNDSGGGSGSGGGSSGSDDSGGGSSILDGLGKVFGAIGKAIDKIIGFLLDIIAKIVEGFTKILDLFAGTFTKLVDLVPSGFNDFLSAMFPYIPEDWITLVTASITIFALGALFWFLRGR